MLSLWAPPGMKPKCWTWQWEDCILEVRQRSILFWVFSPIDKLTIQLSVAPPSVQLRKRQKDVQYLSRQIQRQPLFYLRGNKLNWNRVRESWNHRIWIKKRRRLRWRLPWFTWRLIRDISLRRTMVYLWYSWKKLAAKGEMWLYVIRENDYRMGFFYAYWQPRVGTVQFLHEVIRKRQTHGIHVVCFFMQNFIQLAVES